MGTKQRGGSVTNGDRWRAAAAAIDRPPPSHEEGFDRIETQPSVLLPVQERRRHRRKNWTTRLHLTIERGPGNEAGHEAGPKEATVRTKDLSRSGFSFIYRQYIPEGSIVTTRIASTHNAPELRGQVRRCVHMSKMDHLVGVEFIEVCHS